MVLSLMSEGSLHPWKCFRACSATGLSLEHRAEILQMLNTQISMWWLDILLQLVWGPKRDLGLPRSQEKDRENWVWRPQQFPQCLLHDCDWFIVPELKWKMEDLRALHARSESQTHPDPQRNIHIVWGPCIVPTWVWEHEAQFQLHSSPNFAVPHHSQSWFLLNWLDGG